MGRFAYFDNDDTHKFWFGTQSSEDITSLGGVTLEPQTIGVLWEKDRDYKPLLLKIKQLEEHLKAEWDMTYDKAMEDEMIQKWSKGDESKMWKVVARLDLAYKIKKGLEENEELSCEADYY
jgi:hypothetical protein|tara:strand:+ start:69 stop:431 length:363 start_codon:yes stop_codon:yes gene_type:complete